MPRDEGTSCRSLALLAMVIAAVIFVLPLFVPFPLLDPDEGLHAAIAQEMVERGDYITPRFLGEPFFDKPILYFWIQAASLRLLGTNEAAVRLPGLMFGLLGAVTTGLLAWRMFGRMAGWIAGIFYATTILPTALAQAASHDVALVPCVNAAILLLWETICIPHTPCVDSGTRRVPNTAGDGTRSVPSTMHVIGGMLGAGVFLGLSILTKGLLGVAVVGLAVGGYLLIARRVRLATVLQGAAVLLIAALVAAPWYLAVEWRNPDFHFLRYYFLDRHLLGFATGTQPHSDQPWWYYLPILLGGGLPWIAYVRWAGGITEGGRRKAEGGLPASAFPLSPSPLVFLWFWLIAWIAFLTVAQSKLATYLWPAFPPLAILAAVAWMRMICGSLCGAAVPPAQAAETAAPQRAFARSFVSSCWCGPIVLPAAAAALQWVFAIRFGWPAWTTVVLVAAASPLPLLPWYKGRRLASLSAAALSVAAQFVVVITLILPPLAAMYSARDLAEHFNRLRHIPARLWMVEERLGSLVFYLTPQLRASLKDDQIEYLAGEPPKQMRSGEVLAVKEHNLAKAAELLDRLGLSDEPYETVGPYRLYRIAKQQAKGSEEVVGAVFKR